MIIFSAVAAAVGGSLASFDAIRRCDAALARLLGLALIAFVRAAACASASSDSGGDRRLSRGLSRGLNRRREWMTNARDRGFLFNVHTFDEGEVSDLSVAMEELGRVTIVLVDEPGANASQLEVPGAAAPAASFRITCSAEGDYVVALNLEGAKESGAESFSIEIVTLLTVDVSSSTAFEASPALSLSGRVNAESCARLLEHAELCTKTKSTAPGTSPLIARLATIAHGGGGGDAAPAAAAIEDIGMLVAQCCRVFGGGRVVSNAGSRCRDGVTQDLSVALLKDAKVSLPAVRAAVRAIISAGVRTSQ